MKAIKEKIKLFFRESFRERNKEDFDAVLDKNRGGAESAILTFPWLYLRVLGIGFTVYSALALLFYFLFGFGSTEELRILGVSAFAFSALLFVFEIVPRGSVSLFRYSAIFFFGGFISIFAIRVFNILPDRDFVEQTHCLHEIAEEVCKAVPAFLLIRLFKKKAPADGFLIGAAVGGGFTFLENLSYANGFVISSVTESIAIRGLMNLFGHILWTGFLGFAFCACRKPLKNIRFYLSFFIACLSHVFWNFPFDEFLPAAFSQAGLVYSPYFWVKSALKAVLNVLLWCFVMKRLVRPSRQSDGGEAETPEAADDEKREVLGEEDEESRDESRKTPDGMPAEGEKKEPFSFRYRRRLSLMLCTAILMSMSSISICLEPESLYDEKETGEVHSFGKVDAFTQYLSGGRDLTVDLDRPYDPAGENVSERRELNQTVNAEQKVDCPDGDCFVYFYWTREDVLTVYEIAYYPEGISSAADYHNGDRCYLKTIFDKNLEENFDVFDAGERNTYVYGRDYAVYFDWQNRLSAFADRVDIGRSTDTGEDGTMPYWDSAAYFYEEAEVYLSDGEVFCDVPADSEEPAASVFLVISLVIAALILTGEGTYLLLSRRREKKVALA